MSIAIQCRFKTFQYQDAGAFANDKTAAIEIKRNGCTNRIAGFGQGHHIGKAGNGDAGQRRFRATGNTGIHMTVFDPTKSLSNGMRSGCAGCGHAIIGPLAAQKHGNPAGGHVGNHHGDEKRRNAAWSAAQIKFFIFGLKGFQSADTAADDRAHRFAP